MVTLRNVWKDIVSLFKPEGHPDSVTVEPGQTVEVPGELAAVQPHEDAIVVDQPSGEKLAYPKALWEHVADASGEKLAAEDAHPASEAAHEPAAPVAPAPVFGTSPEPVSVPAPAAPSEG